MPGSTWPLLLTSRYTFTSLNCAAVPEMEKLAWSTVRAAAGLVTVGAGDDDFPVGLHLHGRRPVGLAAAQVEEGGGLAGLAEAAGVRVSVRGEPGDGEVVVARGAPLRAAGEHDLAVGLDVDRAAAVE